MIFCRTVLPRDPHRELDQEVESDLRNYQARAVGPDSAHQAQAIVHPDSAHPAQAIVLLGSAHLARATVPRGNVLPVLATGLSTVRRGPVHPVIVLLVIGRRDIVHLGIVPPVLFICRPTALDTGADTPTGAGDGTTTTAIGGPLLRQVQLPGGYLVVSVTNRSTMIMEPRCTTKATMSITTTKSSLPPSNTQSKRKQLLLMFRRSLPTTWNGCRLEYLR